jgi:uroporphyrinogen-III synthase
VSTSSFDAFCRFAFTFLEEQGVRYLVIGGLAVVAVGEPRTTADADAIVFLSPSEAEALIGLAAGAGTSDPSLTRQ